LIYQQTIGRCVIVDPALQRRILVDRAGSQSTVVWNPWIAKSIRMPDFGDHEWPGMMCLETANVGSSAVVLNPGQVHVLRTEISTAPLPKQN
jgi:D-hexose-6-phosphate mutarotase